MALAFSMPLIDPTEPIGHHLWIKEHKAGLDSHPENIKFYSCVNEDDYEELIAYDNFIAFVKKDSEQAVLWKYKPITAHKGPNRAKRHWLRHIFGCISIKSPLLIQSIGDTNMTSLFLSLRNYDQLDKKQH